MSPVLEERMLAAIGDATTCPHGHPIPNEDGSRWRHEGALELSELPVNAATYVLEVSHDMPELLKFLGEIGLMPRAEVIVRQRERVAGLMTLGLADGDRTVSLQLGKSIVVYDPRLVHGERAHPPELASAIL